MVTEFEVETQIRIWAVMTLIPIRDAHRHNGKCFSRPCRGSASVRPGGTMAPF
jgi:hypothetical protein